MACITKEDLTTLANLNNQRDLLQKRLVEEAKKLLEVWAQLEPQCGIWTEFLTAELVKDGAVVAVTFAWADSVYENFGPRTEEFPIDWFVNSKWHDDSTAYIANVKAEEEEKAARVAALKAELSALGEGNR